MKPKSNWLLNEAIGVVRILEGHATPKGWHTALTGGVLYRGESQNDIDVIVYPHKTTECCSEDELRNALPLESWEQRKHSPCGDDKEVWAATYQGRGIDIFFLK